MFCSQGRFGAAKKFVHCDAECVGERKELPGLGQGLARFPFGNRPVCYAQLIGEFLLCPPPQLSQTI